MIYKLNTIIFDGALLKRKFGYDFYKDKYKYSGVVVIFEGKTDIAYDRELFFDEYPRFEDSINICWEIPNLQLNGNILFKKFFLTKITEILSSLGKYEKIVLNKNDSIFITNGKNKNKELNVSLLNNVENMFSLGYIGLDNKLLELNKKEKEELCEKINSSFYEIIDSLTIECVKSYK